MLKQSDDQTINFRTVARYLGREKVRIFSLKAGDSKVSPNSWVAEALINLAEYSYKTDLRDDTLYRIDKALKLLSESKDAIHHCNLNRLQIGEHNIRFIFECLDSLLSSPSQHGIASRNKTGSVFRSFVFEYLATNENNRITKQSVRHKSLLPRKNVTRRVLNGESNEGLQSNDTHPLGATPFGSYDELISSSLSKLQNDLKGITDACATDLNTYKNIRETLNTIKATPYDSRHQLLIAKHSKQRFTTKSDIKNFDKIPAIELLSCYLNFIENHKLHHAGALPHIKYRAKELLISAGITIPEHLVKKHIYGLPERLSLIELQAIMLTLLCHTGWNVNSLLNLTTEGITPQSDGFELQGFKDKTDEKTPFSFVDKKETKLIESINLLLWNRKQLIKLGFIKESDKRLWFSWTNNSQPYVHQTTALHHISIKFIARHNLSHFSAEQIRTQVMNIRQYQTRDIEDTRRAAGHKSINTTAGYLDQVFSYNINSSINLDFQQKLENKVIFNMGKEKRLDENSHFKLIPIGDGASCINPQQPPDIQNPEDNFICSAQKCHQGDGCENRLIIITQDRLIEIARQNHYYSSNWKRLHAQNPENFKLIIAPAMLFNTLLHDFIITTAYGHILKKMARALEDE